MLILFFYYILYSRRFSRLVAASSLRYRNEPRHNFLQSRESSTENFNGVFEARLAQLILILGDSLIEYSTLKGLEMYTFSEVHH